MGDVRAMLDSPYLRAWDLAGKDHTVEIERVVQGEVTSVGGKKNMPMLHFVGKKKPLGLNATNIKTIISIVGSPLAEKWPGHKVTLYPTMTNTKEGPTECIRIRNRAPE